MRKTKVANRSLLKIIKRMQSEQSKMKKMLTVSLKRQAASKCELGSMNAKLDSVLELQNYSRKENNAPTIQKDLSFIPPICPIGTIGRVRELNRNSKNKAYCDQMVINS